MSHYQVTYVHDDVARFATATPAFSLSAQEQEQAQETGSVWVDDAVFNERSLVAEADLEDVEGPLYPNAYDLYVQEQFEAARRDSNAMTGLVPGKLFSVTVMDGRAWYVVVKVNLKTVDVAWRGFSPDRYVDRALGYGGRLPRSMVEPIVEREEKLRLLFAA